MIIRTYCSKEKEKLLLINNEEINLDNYKKLKEKPEDLFEYISKVDIVLNMKNNRKSLIFKCKYITEEEFKDFIKLLSTIGFETLKEKQTHIIQGVNDNCDKVIYNYNFNTIKPEEKDNKYYPEEYIIKINCTTKIDLQLNKQQINLDNENYKKIQENPKDFFEYISKVETKTEKEINTLNFTYKKQDITEKDFKNFIERFKTIGFKSVKKNSIIECIYYNKKKEKVSQFKYNLFLIKKIPLYKQENLYIRN